MTGVGPEKPKASDSSGGPARRTASKIQFGTQLPPDLVARVRSAVVTLQHGDPSVTITSFVEDALTAALDVADVAVVPQESPADSTGTADLVRPTQAGLRRGRRIQQSSDDFAMTGREPVEQAGGGDGE